MDDIQVADPVATQCFDQGRIFFRPQDRDAFQGVLRAFEQEGRIVAIVSASDGALDHYGRMLLRALRDSSVHAVEVYFPTSTEWLLSRFNDLLAPLTVRQATSRNSVLAPRILVINDAAAVPQPECQLLARLVNDFPGSNVRLVLMVHERADVSVDALLEPFGKRTIRWDVTPPDDDEARSLEEAAQVLGREQDLRTVLRLAALSAEAPVAPASDPIPALPAAPWFGEPGGVMPAADAADAAPTFSLKAMLREKRTTLLALCLLLLFAGAYQAGLLGFGSHGESAATATAAGDPVPVPQVQVQAGDKDIAAWTAEDAARKGQELWRQSSEPLPYARSPDQGLYPVFSVGFTAAQRPSPAFLPLEAVIAEALDGA